MATKFTIPSEYDRMRWFDAAVGQWKDLSTTSYIHRAQRTEIPNSVKRPFPADPFASATPRVVTKYVTSAPITGFRHRSWAYKGPMSAVIPVGATGDSLGFSHVVCDQKLRAKIKSQKLNALQTLAELPQTVSMVSSLARDIRYAFRMLRPGFAFANIVAALQRPQSTQEKDLANKWLELQYGWKPALQDIYGAVDAIHNRVSLGIPQYVEARDRSDRRIERNLVARFDGGDVPYVESVDMTVQLVSSARYIVRDTTTKSLVESGISNPALLAWELIPYSFVIDQLIPIGDWLSSLDALVGVEGLVVQRGYRTRYDYVRSCAYGATVYRTESKVRLGTSADLAIGWPSPKSPAYFGTLVNDIALLRQLL